nr:MAG TPA: hypothetical protein [Caudoviricetes sp.]
MVFLDLRLWMHFLLDIHLHQYSQPKMISWILMKHRQH